MDDLTQPPDNLFRAVFGDDCAEAAGLLRAHLPAALADGLRWWTLSVELTPHRIGHAHRPSPGSVRSSSGLSLCSRTTEQTEGISQWYRTHRVKQRRRDDSLRRGGCAAVTNDRCPEFRGHAAQGRRG